MPSRRFSANVSLAVFFLLVQGLSAFAADTDGDGLDDAVETNTGVYVSPSDTGTDPNVADTDGDSVDDGSEVSFGTDPTDLTESPIQDKVLATDTAAGDQLGRSVAISGDTAVVGAFLDDDSGGGSGSATVFVRSAGVWTQQAKLTANDAAGGDWFGYAVAIDGDSILVGARRNDDAGANSGSAYIFTRTGSAWSQLQKLTANDAAADDEFGFSVAIEGGIAIVGAFKEDGVASDSGAAYIFAFNGSSWGQQRKLTAGDAAAGDQYGFSVSVSGESVVVGSRWDDDAGADSGSAYVYTRSGVVWSEQQKLVASDAEAGDGFGRSVSLSGDSVLVGADLEDAAGFDAGAAYVYVRTGVTWSEEEKLTAVDAAAGDGFGNSVSIVGDLAVVGAHLDDDSGTDSGSVYLYRRSAGSWSEIEKLTANDGATGDWFGRRVANDGTTVAVGAYLDDDAGSNSGAAYLLDLNPDGDGLLNSDENAAGTNPTLADSDGDGFLDDVEVDFGTDPLDGDNHPGQAKVRAGDEAGGDEFGRAVAIDDDTLVIGSPLDEDAGTASGAAYVFVRSGPVWTEQAKLVAIDAAVGDQFGSAVAVDGDTALVGAPADDDSNTDTGSVYVFTRSGTVWTQQAKLNAAAPLKAAHFGDAIDLEGGVAVIGARFDDTNGIAAGKAYIFSGSGASWIEDAVLTPSDATAGDEFGESVALDGARALIGASRNDDAGAESGSAYVFIESAGVWTEEVKLTAIDAAADDRFGEAVALQGDTAVLGAPFNDDDGSNSGSVYVFTRSAGSWSQAQKLTPSTGGATDWFGRSVALDGSYLAAGAPQFDDAGANTGSVYVYRLEAGSWVQDARIAHTGASVGDEWGHSVALSGDQLAAGLHLDDDAGTSSGSALVIDIDTDDDGLTNEGERIAGSDALDPDTDGDGLLDGFEVAHGFDPLMAGEETGDPDGDGLDNLAEQAEGTDPNAADSDGDGVPDGLEIVLGTDPTDPESSPLAQRVLASDALVFGDFGRSVAIDGDRAVVGAPLENLSALSSGAAYVFERIAGQWSEVGKLDPADNEADDWFGRAVAIDGTTIVVGAQNDDDGATNAGAVYIFVETAGVWVLEQKIIAGDPGSGDQFGASVSISGDTALVGAQWNDDAGNDSGSAYIFTRSAGVWSQEEKLTAIDAASNDYFGSDVSVFGDRALIGARGDGGAVGAAYVFQAAGGIWSETAKLVASDGGASHFFGFSVALEGDFALVGAPGLASSSAIPGFAYAFRYDGSAWNEEAKLLALDGQNDDLFGVSVAIAGSRALVGASGDDDSGTSSGSAYVFLNEAGAWSELQKIVAVDGEALDAFGAGVAFSGDVALVGSPKANFPSVSGAAYFYELDFDDDGLENVRELTYGTDIANPDTDGDGLTDLFEVLHGFDPLVGGEQTGDPDLDGLDNLAEQAAGTDPNDADSDDDGLTDFAEVMTHLTDPLSPDTDGDGLTDGFEILHGFDPLASGDGALDPDADGLDNLGEQAAGTDPNDPDVDGDGLLDGFEVAHGFDPLVAGEQTGDPDGDGLDNLAEQAAGTDPNASDSDGDGFDDPFELTLGSDPTDANSTPLGQKIFPDDPVAGQNFASGVAVDGDTLVLGVPSDDTAGTMAGAAYVFVRTGSVWAQQAKLIPLDAAAMDEAGAAVAISGDTVLVGAPVEGSTIGAVYVFTRTGTVWSEQAKLVPSSPTISPHFGSDVVLDGDTALIAAAGDDSAGSNAGAAYVFTRSGSVWTEAQKLTGLDTVAGDRFGEAIALEGDRALIGAPGNDISFVNGGSAYVFDRSAGVFAETTRLLNGVSFTDDEFGIAVSLSGDRALIGARLDGQVGFNVGTAYVFEIVLGEWVEQVALRASDHVPGDLFADRVSISGDVAFVAASSRDIPATDTGRLYVFMRSNGAWTERAILEPDEPSVSLGAGAIDSVGGTVFAPAPFDDEKALDAGAVLAFATDPDSDGLVNDAEIVAGTDLFDPDSDGDTLLDGFEVVNGFDPLMGGDETGDPDADGLDNAGEQAAETDPNDSDSDDDGLLDGAEVLTHGTDPWSVDTDLDGLLDEFEVVNGFDPLVGGDETGDPDADGLDNLSEQTEGTNPNDPDTDGDGLLDLYELTHGFDPLVPGDEIQDPDSDGLDNLSEQSEGTDPHVADTDSDGFDDGTEVFVGTDPLDLAESPLQTVLVASDTGNGDGFGTSIARDGNTLVVGAPGDETLGSGAAYVFMRIGGVWSEQAKLLPSDPGSVGGFGRAVAIDGDTVVVGGTIGTKVFVFTGGGAFWTEEDQLVGLASPSGVPTVSDGFGARLDIDGDTILVGSHKDDWVGFQTDRGSARVFTRSASVWTEEAFLSPLAGGNLDEFGSSVSIVGDTAVIGARGESIGATRTGVAYVFTRSAGVWTEEVTIPSPDPIGNGWFGHSAHLSDGRVLIGAPGNNAVWQFDGSGAVWTETAKIESSTMQAFDDFGYSIAEYGDLVSVGVRLDDGPAGDAGSAMLFARDGMGVPIERDRFTATNGFVGGWLGFSVAVGRFDSLAGRPGQSGPGAVYVFRHDMDEDGILNIDEALHGTDELDPDSDSDGLLDGFEVENGFDPLTPGEAGQDPDGDLLDNFAEQANETDPHDPDTDGDGFDDAVEVTAGSDPLDPASTPGGLAVPAVPLAARIGLALLLALVGVWLDLGTRVRRGEAGS